MPLNTYLLYHSPAFRLPCLPFLDGYACCLLDQTRATGGVTKLDEESGEPSTPLYSIGTPSSSDENLFEEMKINTTEGNVTETPSRESLKDLDLNTSTPPQGDKVIVDEFNPIDAVSDHSETASKSSCMEVQDKTLEVSNNTKSLEEDESIFESGKYLDSDEDLSKASGRRIDEGFAGETSLNSAVESEILTSHFTPGSNEQVKQNVEVEFKEERLVMDQKKSDLEEPSKKLNNVLTHLKLQLTSLRYYVKFWVIMYGWYLGRICGNSLV